MHPCTHRQSCRRGAAAWLGSCCAWRGACLRRDGCRVQASPCAGLALSLHLYHAQTWATAHLMVLKCLSPFQPPPFSHLRGGDAAGHAGPAALLRCDPGGWRQHAAGDLRHPGRITHHLDRWVAELLHACLQMHTACVRVRACTLSPQHTRIRAHMRYVFVACCSRGRLPSVRQGCRLIFARPCRSGTRGSLAP